MKTRNIIPNEGGEAFAVGLHIIVRNMWEYYLEEPDENGIAFGYVMGMANEWGSVDINELEPYTISIAKGEAIGEIMPPQGYHWEDES